MFFLNKMLFLQKQNPMDKKESNIREAVICVSSMLEEFSTRHGLLSENIKKNISENCTYMRNTIFSKKFTGKEIHKTTQQDALSRVLGIHTSTIRRIEGYGFNYNHSDEESSFRLDALIRYAAFFDIDVEKLLKKNGVIGWIGADERKKRKLEGKDKDCIEVLNTDRMAYIYFYLDNGSCFVRLPNGEEKNLKVGYKLVFTVNDEYEFDVVCMRELPNDEPFIVFDNKKIINLKFIPVRSKAICPERHINTKNLCHSLTIIFPDAYHVSFKPEFVGEGVVRAYVEG